MSKYKKKYCLSLPHSYNHEIIPEIWERGISEQMFRVKAHTAICVLV
jgi:hypothetical protein